MNLVSRSQWGARAPKAVTPIGAVSGVAIHYEGPHIGTFAHDLCDDKIRGIQNFHMNTRGWNDIAYNFMVCPHGVVYECRGLRARSAAQGTNDGNNRYLAICFLLGVDDVFNDAMKQGGNDAIAHCRANGAGSEIRPHKSFHATACPGVPVSTWLLQGRPVGNNPSPIPSPPPVVPPPATGPDWLEAVMPKIATLDLRNAGRTAVRHYLVDNLQGLLTGTQNAAWNPKGIDGVAGGNTLAAVKAFQSGKKLTADGIVGPKTWEALFTH